MPDAQPLRPSAPSECSHVDQRRALSLSLAAGPRLPRPPPAGRRDPRWPFDGRLTTTSDQPGDPAPRALRQHPRARPAPTWCDNLCEVAPSCSFDRMYWCARYSYRTRAVCWWRGGLTAIQGDWQSKGRRRRKKRWKIWKKLSAISDTVRVDLVERWELTRQILRKKKEINSSSYVATNQYCTRTRTSAGS